MKLRMGISVGDNILKKTEDYNAGDLVKYYIFRYKKVLKVDYTVNWWFQECSQMKRLQSYFLIRNKSNRDVCEFIDWSMYKSKKTYGENGGGARIGILYSHIKDYFKLRGWEEEYLSNVKIDEDNLSKEML